MDNIVAAFVGKKWNIVKNLIKNKKIKWDYLIDQTNTAIHYLAYQGKLDLIKMIEHNDLKKIINIPNTENNTIAHIAAILNNTKLLKFIVEIDPKIIYTINNLGRSVLYYVVSDTNLIKYIVKNYVIEDHYIYIQNYTLIEYYILSKNIDMVAFLLDNIKINTLTNSALFTTIQLSSDGDSVVTEETDHTQNFDLGQYKLDILNILLMHGVDINSLNEEFLSPLIISVATNSYQISKFLLKNGANINYSGPENDQNPLSTAIKNSNISLIKLILDNNIKVNFVDKYLKTPAHYIFSEKNNIPISIKKILLSKTKNINKEDDQMDTILNLLVHYDDWRNYQDILKTKKLKIYQKNRIGIMPIDAINNKDMRDFYYLVYKSYINQLRLGIKFGVLWVDEMDQKIGSTLYHQNNIQPKSKEKYYKKYIIEKIKSGQSYPIKKNNTAILKLLIPAETNISHFSGYTYNYICYLLDFLKRYSCIKIPCLAPDQIKNKSMKSYYEELINDYKEKTPTNKIFRSIIRDYINHWPGLINHVIVWKNNENYFFSPYIIQGIHETLNKFPTTRFILLKLTIISNAYSNHANIIIMDIKNKYVERFDPYGVVPFVKGPEIDNLMESFFSEYFPTFKYLSPSKIINSISFQIFSDERNEKNHIENDPNGFCVAWCLWYLETRIKNINIYPKSLIKRTVVQINKNETKFKDYIRNYANYLDNEKNLILEDAGIPKKYWYSSHIPHKLYKSYLGYIRKMYDYIFMEQLV